MYFVSIEGGLKACIPDANLGGIQPPVSGMNQLAEANRLLGKLDGITTRLEKEGILVYPSLLKEATASSRIEGTRASFTDLLEFEVQPSLFLPEHDVREISNYVRAIRKGFAQLVEVPLSQRLLRELHRELLEGVRGASRDPGYYRRLQVHIGPGPVSSAPYIPPPASYVPDLMVAWERYLHTTTEQDPLVKSAILHAQFELIHPFLDGNGRLGRLLISLYLAHCGVLKHPVLVLSEWLEEKRSEYYESLRVISAENKWEPWLMLFTEAVRDQAARRISVAGRQLDLHRQYRKELHSKTRSAAALAAVDCIFERIMVSAKSLAADTKKTPQWAMQTLKRLQSYGMIEEVTSRRRGRVFVCRELLRLLERESTPPAPS